MPSEPAVDAGTTPSISQIYHTLLLYCEQWSLALYEALLFPLCCKNYSQEVRERRKNSNWKSGWSFTHHPPPDPCFSPLDSLCSASWFFSLPQPNVGNVNQQKAASDLQGGIWIHFFKKGQNSYISSRKELFLNLKRLRRIWHCVCTQKTRCSTCWEGP